jgi:hypothetical protein
MQMSNAVDEKASEIREALAKLGKQLSAGDDGELLVWVIPNRLACAHRPLRHHPVFGDSGRDLPSEAAPEVLKWVRRIKEDYGIQSIIPLISTREIRHYAQLDLGAEDLIDLYRKNFEVRHIPWEDPAHRLVKSSEASRFKEELARVKADALRAYDELPKPVLIHCSAGIDRSSPVAAHIWVERASAEHS